MRKTQIPVRKKEGGNQKMEHQVKTRKKMRMRQKRRTVLMGDPLIPLRSLRMRYQSANIARHGSPSVRPREAPDARKRCGTSDAKQVDAALEGRVLSWRCMPSGHAGLGTTSAISSKSLMSSLVMP